MKEQNKLWGENELAENRRKKPNNLLNNPGVKGLFEPFRSKKALWRKLELPAFANGREGAKFERLLQTWTLAGVQNSARWGILVGEAVDTWGEHRPPVKWSVATQHQITVMG